jgi:hypothetical protein
LTDVSLSNMMDVFGDNLADFDMWE